MLLTTLASQATQTPVSSNSAGAAAQGSRREAPAPNGGNPTAATQPRLSTKSQIPPDVAAVLGDAPIHPELLRRAPKRPAAPTPAALTEAALALAALAAADVGKAAETLASAVREQRSPGVEAIIHSVGKGGVLHLKPTASPRAVSLVSGVLAQRCTQRPLLRPGVVRLVAAGRALTLADLGGDGALAVEVHIQIAGS